MSTDIVDASSTRKSPWNSLEIAKILIGALTPLLIALVGFQIQNSLKQQEQTRNESWQISIKLADRRLNAYDEIRAKLNRIYCFIEDVGTWKGDNPETIIALRREIHASMHPQRALWSPDTFAAYIHYMDESAFELYQGVGADPKVRTTDNQKRSIKGWTDAWSNQLTNPDGNHQYAYDQLLSLIARDLMLGQQPKIQIKPARRLKSWS